MWSAVYKGRIIILLFCSFFSSFFIHAPAALSKDLLSFINQSLEQAKKRKSINEKIALYTKTLDAVLSFYEQGPLMHVIEARDLLTCIKEELKILKQAPLKVIEYNSVQSALYTLERVHKEINSTFKATVLRYYLASFIIIPPVSLCIMGSFMSMWAITRAKG